MKAREIWRHVWGLPPAPTPLQMELSPLEKTVLKLPYAQISRMVEANLKALSPITQHTIEFELVRITGNHCFYAYHPQYGAVGFTLSVLSGYAGETLGELHAQGWKPGALVDIELDATGRVRWARLHPLH